MNEPQAPKTPFKTLGTHLRYLREQSEETAAEVSGAVEIDEQLLSQIESGFERPSEDILLLLISHFDLEEQTALQLWQLAGYDGAPETVRLAQEPTASTQFGQAKAVVMLALDARVIYSDGFEILTGQSGVTLNFSQHTGADERNVVSRLGMSYEQAEQVMQSLQQGLLRAKYSRGPKALPPGDVA